jgi:hypothetical protein
MNHNINEIQFPRDKFSFINHLISSQVNNAKRLFEEKLKCEIIKELRRYDITFKDDYEFNDFCNHNIMRVNYGDRPFYNELYLKNGDKEKILLLKYSDKVEIKFDSEQQNILNVTFGE